MGQHGQLNVDVQVENGESDGGQLSISANIYIYYIYSIQLVRLLKCTFNLYSILYKIMHVQKYLLYVSPSSKIQQEKN